MGSCSYCRCPSPLLHSCLSDCLSSKWSSGLMTGRWTIAWIDQTYSHLYESDQGQRNQSIDQSTMWPIVKIWPRGPEVHWTIKVTVILVKHSGITTWRVNTKLEKILHQFLEKYKYLHTKNSFWWHWDASSRIRSNTDFLCGTTMRNASAKPGNLLSWQYANMHLHCSGWLSLDTGSVDSKHLSSVTVHWTYVTL